MPPPFAFPLGAARRFRASRRVGTGLSFEEHARQARIKRLRQLSAGWRDRVARVVSAADGFSLEGLLATIEVLKELALKAPKLSRMNSKIARRLNVQFVPSNMFTVWFERVYARRDGRWQYLSHRTVHGPTYGS